jgi:pimeloyl-ACP methyl ester carboxylesterase
MEFSSIPIPNPAAILQEGQDGWAVLVNLDTAGSLALNPTGVVVWRLVDGKRNVGGIIAAVSSHFKDVPDTMADDVSALLDTLAEEGLIGHEWGGEVASQPVSKSANQPVGESTGSGE